MSDYYTLDNRKAVPCSLHVWGAMMQDACSLRVAGTSIGDMRVSTVFLGLDRSFGEGPPLLFETMAFGLPESEGEWQERCTTWEQAEAMHEAMCDRVRAL